MASLAQSTDSSESVPSMQEPAESQDEGSLNTSDKKQSDREPQTQSWLEQFWRLESPVSPVFRREEFRPGPPLPWESESEEESEEELRLPRFRLSRRELLRLPRPLPRRPLPRRPPSPLREQEKKEAKKHFEDAMKTGYVECTITTIAVTGAPGSGKSHTMSLVFNEDPPAVRESTGLCQPVRAISTVVGTSESGSSEWTIVDEDKVLNIVVGATSVTNSKEQPAFLSKDASEPSGSSDAEGSSIASDSFEASDTQGSSNASNSSDSSEALESSNASCDTEIEEQASHIGVVDELLGKLANRVKVSGGQRRVTKLDFLYFLDSGGQPQFHELLPSLVPNLSAILFVLKLSEKLSHNPEVEFYEKGKLVCSYQSPFSHEQILKRCIRALQPEKRSYESSSSSSPCIAVVGTHRDLELSCEGETREKKNQILLDLLQPTFGNNLIFYQNVTKLIFPVNAKEPSQEDRAVASDLREEIIRLSAQKPVRIPLPWFILEQVLRRLAKERGTGVMHIDRCREVAKKLYIDDDAFDAALKHLVSLKIFLYYPTVLPNVLFCDPHVALDKINELVGCYHTLCGESNTLPGNTALTLKKWLRGEKWIRFKRFGVFQEALLHDKAFSRHYDQDLFTPSDLLKLLEALLIVGKVSTTDVIPEYIMPSLLFELKPDDLDKHRCNPATSPAAPLLVYFPGEWPTSGVFCSFLTSLLSTCNWGVMIDKRNNPTCLYRNCLEFQHPKMLGKITLIDSFDQGYFEVHVRAPLEECKQFCPVIRQDLVTALPPKAPEAELAHFCPRSGSTFCSSSLHLAHILPRHNYNYWRCSENPGKVYGSLAESPNLIVWGNDTTAKQLEADQDVLAPSFPRNLRVERVSGELALKASWDAPSDNGGRPVMSYTVLIREVVKNNPAVDFTALDALPVMKTSQVQFTYHIRDSHNFHLTNNALYEVQVAANNISGPGPSSTTTGRTVLPAPTITRVEPLNSTTLTVEWQPPAGSILDAIRSWEVWYEVAGGEGRKDVVVTIDDPGATAHTQTVDKGTIYHLHVAGQNVQGKGCWSPYMRAETPVDPPSTPQNLTVDHEEVDGELALKASWKAPRDNGGRPVMSYTVLIREVVKNKPAIDFTALTPLSDIKTLQMHFAYYIRDTPNFPLTNNTVYEVQVAARNECGPGPSSTATGRTVDKGEFEIALKKKRKMPLCIAQCVTVGAPQTGKTSLKRRLLKQTNQPSGSTGVAEKPVVSAVTADGSDWIVLEWEEEGAQFLQGVKQQHSSPKGESSQLHTPSISIPEVTKQVEGSYSATDVAVQEPEPETTLPVDANEDSIPHQYPSPKLTGDVTEVDRKLSKPKPLSYSNLIDIILDVDSEKWIAAKDRLENQCTIYFTDTGGQLEFQEVLPAIISGPSIFLLVFNLEHAAEGLDQEFDAVYKRGNGSIYEPPPGISTFTVRDSILHILASIQAIRCYHFKKDGDDIAIEPRVLLVGTHSDCVTDESVLDKVESDIQELLKDTPYYENGMLQVPCTKEQNEKFVYMVNNKSSEDPVFQEIREKVRSLIFKKSGDSDYKEDIPADWLGFDLMLRLPGGSKILDYQQSVDMAHRFGIKENDVEEALTFLHKRFGIIRYFKGEGLGNIVITNPQVIYNLLSDLIAEQFNYSDTDCGLTIGKVKEFREKGLISVKSVECVAAQRSKTLAAYIPYLLHLLGHLHIVLKIEGDEENRETKYFIPCVLAGTIPDLSTLKEKEKSEPLAADLLVVFEHGRQYCPKGLFSVLVIKLAQKPRLQEAKYTWKLNREKLGRESVVFRIDVKDPSCSYTVHIQHGLVGCRSVLRVFVEKLHKRSCIQLQPKHNLESVCKEIRDSVKTDIESSLEELNRDTYFNIGFYSICNKNQISSRKHIAIIDHSQELSGSPHDMICIDCNKDVYSLEEEHSVWFRQVPQVLNSTSQAGSNIPTMPKLVNFPGQEKRINIPKEIGKNYKTFGIVLLEDDSGSRVDNIIREHRENAELINIEVLQEWLAGRGKQPVTWKTLVDILQDIGLSTLAGVISTSKCPSEQ